MKAEASVDISRPIEEVFEFTNEHVVEWSITVVEDTVIEETPGQVGTTFKCVTKSEGRLMEFHGTVTRWEPPKLSAIELVGGAFDIHAEYTFDEIPDGTRVTQKSVISPHGIMKIVFACMSVVGWLTGRSACGEVENELENLKGILEKRNNVAEE